MTLPVLTVDWSLSFNREVNRVALAYWQARRGPRNRPSRSDIDPVDMREFLPNVALVDVLQPEGAGFDYRFRLVGGHIEEVFGAIGGRDIASVFPPDLEPRWRSSFDTAREADRPVRLAGHVGFENKVWLAFESLLAPLGEESGPASMLFGVFASWPDQELVG
jgi:hypothetical protein